MADISSIKLPDNSSYDIKAKKIFYAECSTARNVAAKAVTCSGFVLEAGAVIAVRFTNTGTANPSSGNITLNINGTGAKNIVPKGNNSVYNYGWGWAFCNNQTWLFIYNGTYFVCLNQDNNSDTKVTNTLATTKKAYVTGTTSATTNTGTQVFDTGVYLDTTAGMLTAATFKGALSGNASSATKLNDSAGSATQPVYFSEGKPVATTYSLGKSVPSNAVFTDTWRGIQNNLTSDSASDSLSAAQGKILKALVDGKAAASHTHTVSQISDFPASLPANGGNADTLGLRYSYDFLGKDYVYPTFVNYGFGADLNNYVTEYHGFVYNCLNSPIAHDYGFLDVSFFDGTGFSPSPADKGGVVLQKFFRTDNCVFTRTRVTNVWSDWSRLDSESHATGIISGLANGTSITIPLSFSPVAVLFFDSSYNHLVNSGFSLSFGTSTCTITPSSVSTMGTTSVRYLAFGG